MKLVSVLLDSCRLTFKGRHLTHALRGWEVHLCGVVGVSDGRVKNGYVEMVRAALAAAIVASRQSSITIYLFLCKGLQVVE
ncbi:conserved hypothetical protein [Ricinus communis]|uniref:Uncharacterized protein n=1 Tax=Ricinus communis TaxID=3988 RepID=B9RB68_RICCO|nr:conserved hypothetical protein [Ricinus communis]